MAIDEELFSFRTKKYFVEKKNIKPTECSEIGKWKRKDEKSTDKVNICLMIILHVDRIIRTTVESDRSSSSSFMMNFSRKCYHVLLFSLVCFFSHFNGVNRLEQKEINIFFIMCKNLATVTSCVRVCRM
jgi:phage-related holin